MELTENVIELPSYVSAYGWVPFAAVILMSLLFSLLYVKHLQSRTEKDNCSSVAAIFGITLALLAAFLLPVDVFLVSYMKNPDGTFKDWATNSTRDFLEDTVTYTYYSIYGIIFVYSFCILPLTYFYYEEREDDNPFSVCARVLLYSLIFILGVVILFVVGLVIQFKAAPTNSTQWERIDFLVNELSHDQGKDALFFVVHVLTVYGMLQMVIYTGSGLAYFPMTSIRGFRSLKDEEYILSENQTGTQAKIDALRKKQSQRALSSKEASSLASLEEEQSLISRRSLLLETEKSRFCYKLEPITRFVNAFLGIIGLLFSFLLWLSLLICNIDKLLHSLGYKMGYTLSKSKLPNPLDLLMVQTQKVFPLDYIFFFGITIFLVICTISGMRNVGLCCLFVPMYKIRPKRTVPQGLLMMSFTLMFCVFAFNILMFAVIPTYATFGSQSYRVKPVQNILYHLIYLQSIFYLLVILFRKMMNSTWEVHECDLNAPADDCVMSRASTFLLRFAYKAWIFSCVEFWLTWGLLGSFVLGVICNFIWGRKSVLEEAIDRDDFDDELDDQMIRA